MLIPTRSVKVFFEIDLQQCFVIQQQTEQCIQNQATTLLQLDLPKGVYDIPGLMGVCVWKPGQK